MPRKPILAATAACLAAGCLSPSPAGAGLLRLGARPLTGAALAIGGLAAGGTVLSVMAERRRCRADPACAAGRGLVPLRTPDGAAGR